jgi:hypothetical protein
MQKAVQLWTADNFQTTGNCFPHRIFSGLPSKSNIGAEPAAQFDETTYCAEVKSAASTGVVDQLTPNVLIEKASATYRAEFNDLYPTQRCHERGMELPCRTPRTG